MIRTALVAASIAALAAAPGLARATTLSYSAGLSNPVTTIDFSAVPVGDSIGSFYSAQGVTFGGLYSSAVLANTLPPSVSPAAANFSGNTTNATFTISFDTAVTAAAFFLYTDGFGTTITSSLQGATVESVNAGTYSASGNNYFGFTGSAFDQITVAVRGTGTAVIDNVEIGAAATPAVPEPASLALMLAGLTGLSALRRRRA